MKSILSPKEEGLSTKTTIANSPLVRKSLKMEITTVLGSGGVRLSLFNGVFELEEGF